MKLPTIKLFVICIVLPFLFFSCAKEDNNIIESQIVFHVPVYKGNGDPGSSDIIVFPNPFTNYVKVYSSLPEGTSAEVQLNDENGKFSLKITVMDGIYMFDTQDFPEGVYFIEVKKDGYVDRAKLLKLEYN